MNNIFNKIFSIFQHRSVQILLILAIYVSSADYIQIKIHQGFYTISLLIKELLIWIIPITVAMYIATAIQSFEKRAPLFILILIIFEALSNFSSVWYAYITANFASNHLHSFHLVSLTDDFSPLWRLPFIKPDWWSPDKGAIIGLILGRIAAYRKNTFINQFIRSGSFFVELILTRVFGRLIPLFILGFAAQMHQRKLLTHVFTNYSLLVSWLLLFLVIYIFSLFILGAGGSLIKTIAQVKNLLPAGGIALSSGCSLSTMPWTIKGTAKNLQNPFLAQAIIPATTNIQQVGDAIANAFLCFLIYKNFNGYNPDLITWLNFSLIFVVARFATAAMLGGAIFIMLPLYETYLSFNTEMIALILALNVVLDPIITCTNVMANGALCKIFENLWKEMQLFIENFSRKSEPIHPAVNNDIMFESKVE